MKIMEHYFEDTLNQLLDAARELKERAKSELDRGMLLGYYEAISKMLNQAEAFGISDKLPGRVQDFKLENLLK